MGALEVAGAIGLLVPRLAALAALAAPGFVCLMTGAVVTNLLIGANPMFAGILLLIAGVIAYSRWSSTRTPKKGFMR